MIRKFLVGVMVALTCIIGSQYASVNAASHVYGNEEPALGGIRLGANMDYVRSVYGDPGSVEVHKPHHPLMGSQWIRWMYGDSFGILFSDGYVKAVFTSANNGIKTEKGIHVGQNISEAKKVYPTLEKQDDTWYNLWLKRGDVIIFQTNKDGIIKEINLNR
ncbi:MAG: hypothetical protein E7197_07640 [Anaerovibrio sp.]|uniref:hypothetical protein n=1 Tax=Anaerovibrio sp. TaxID=1872532 RepID=UPI0025B7E639|nr:hypothetical protein [Anaerovibrio sp.]MBE6099911.1 hypothetical protein [Anaerovibrio sp.]